MRNDDNPNRWTCVACGIQREDGALQAHLCPGKLKKNPDRPADEQCDSQSRVPDFKGRGSYAAWLPDGARAVLVGTEAGWKAYVWRSDGPPTVEDVADADADRILGAG